MGIWPLLKMSSALWWLWLLAACAVLVDCGRRSEPSLEITEFKCSASTDHIDTWIGSEKGTSGGREEQEQRDREMSFDLSESNPQKPNDKTLMLQRRLRKQANRIAILEQKLQQRVTGREAGARRLLGRRKTRRRTIRRIKRFKSIFRKRKSRMSLWAKRRRTPVAGKRKRRQRSRLGRKYRQSLKARRARHRMRRRRRRTNRRRKTRRRRRRSKTRRTKRRQKKKGGGQRQKATDQYYVKGPGNVKFFYIKDADIAKIKHMAKNNDAATKRKGSFTKTSDGKHCTIAAAYGRVSLQLPRVRDECRSGWCAKGADRRRRKSKCIPRSSKCTGKKLSKKRRKYFRFSWRKPKQCDSRRRRKKRKHCDTSCACVMKKNGSAKHWWDLKKQYQKDPSVTDLFSKLHIKFLKISVCKYVDKKKRTLCAVKKMITGCMQLVGKMPLTRRRQTIKWSQSRGSTGCSAKHQELAVGLI